MKALHVWDCKEKMFKLLHKHHRLQMLANDKSLFTKACVESQNLQWRAMLFLLPEGPAASSYQNCCKVKTLWISMKYYDKDKQNRTGCMCAKHCMVLTTDQGNSHAQQLELALHSWPVLEKRQGKQSNAAHKPEGILHLNLSLVRQLLSAFKPYCAFSMLLSVPQAPWNSAAQIFGRA